MSDHFTELVSILQEEERLITDVDIVGLRALQDRKTSALIAFGDATNEVLKMAKRNERLVEALALILESFAHDTRGPL